MPRSAIVLRKYTRKNLEDVETAFANSCYTGGSQLNLSHLGQENRAPSEQFDNLRCWSEHGEGKGGGGKRVSGWQHTFGVGYQPSDKTHVRSEGGFGCPCTGARFVAEDSTPTSATVSKSLKYPTWKEGGARQPNIFRSSH